MRILRCTALDNSPSAKSNGCWLPAARDANGNRTKFCRINWLERFVSLYTWFMLLAHASQTRPKARTGSHVTMKILKNVSCFLQNIGWLAFSLAFWIKLFATGTIHTGYFVLLVQTVQAVQGTYQPEVPACRWNSWNVAEIVAWPRCCNLILAWSEALFWDEMPSYWNVFWNLLKH